VNELAQRLQVSRRLQDSREQLHRVLLQLARLCTLAVVAAAPWLLGSVALSAQRIVYGVVLVALFCWIGGLACAPPQKRRRPVVLPISIVPLILAIFLGAVQLVPVAQTLGLKLRQIGRPVFAEAFTEDDRQGSPAELEATFSERSTISHYPASTRLDLAQLSIAAVTFLLGALLFPTHKSQLWLWGVLAVDGALLAFFGIVQKLTWNGRLFWTLPVSHGSPFASFVNRNNAAGFLNLCLACGLGFLIWATHRRARKTTRCEPQKAAQESWHTGRRVGGWRRLISFRRLIQPDVVQLTAVLLVLLIVAGVLVTLSRGGVLAALIGAFVAFAALFRSRQTRLSTLVIAGAVVLGVSLVSWLGMSGDLRARFSKMTDTGIGREVRLLNWCDAVKAGTDFWFLGTGLGTYRYAYQPYQDHPIKEWFYHAENQYLEAFVEGGVVGLSLLLAAIVLSFTAAQTLIRSGAHSSTIGAGVAGLFALTSQSVHAICDFGLFIPANMLLFALICGAVTGRTVRGLSRTSQPLLPALAVPHARWFVFPVIGLLAVNGLLGFHEVSVAASVDDAISGIPKLNTARSLDRESVDRAIKRVTLATNVRPDDAELHSHLAKLWIYRYRLQTYDVLKAERAAADANPKPDLWKLTDIGVLHHHANALRRAGRLAQWQAIRDDPLVSGNLASAVEHLLAAKAACPILPKIDLKLAALAFLTDAETADGGRRLRQAVRLAPSDPDVLYTAGLLADHAQHEALAYRCWRQCLSLSGRFQAEILERTESRLGLAEMVDRLLPQSPEFLLDFAREKFPDQTFQEERRLLASKARQLIRVQHSRFSPGKRHYLNAVVYRLADRPEEAVESYQTALSLAPFEVDWRLELATLLKQQGQMTKAHEEARLCASLAPRRRDIRCFLSELNHTVSRRLSTPR